MALIFGILGVVLISIGAVILAKQTITKTDSFARVAIAQGSQTTVELTRTGDYVAYFETPSAGRHTGFVRMAMADANGAEVGLAQYSDTGTTTSTVRYDFNGRHGEALFTFSISEPGTYQVAFPQAQVPPGAQMAFGESIATGLVVGGVLILPGILLVIAAVALLIVGLVKRSRHKRELAAYPYGAPPPNYPPPNYGGQQNYPT